MNDQFEQRVRKIALKQPSAAVRRKIMARARMEMRGQIWWRRLAVATAAAAVLLIAFNIVFSGFYVNSISTQMGWKRSIPSAPPLSQVVRNLKERERIIISQLGNNGNGDEDVHSLRIQPIPAPENLGIITHIPLPSPALLMLHSQYISAAEIPE